MSSSVLVTYATKHGSTGEVAHAVTVALRGLGMPVENIPMRGVQGLDGYDAVVLGFPLYMGHMLRASRRFLTLHREALKTRPVAIFVLGPIHDEEKERQFARGQLKKEMEKFPWLRPVALEVFGGKFDPARLGILSWLLPALWRMPVSDARDWKAIRDWATGLAELISPTFHRAEPISLR